MDLKYLSFILISSLLYHHFNCFSLQATKCTNNKEVNSYSQYIQEFKKSPCSPLVFVPGIMSSNLRVVADCKTMKSNIDNFPRLKTILDVCPFLCKGRDYYENSLWINDKSLLHYVLFNDYNFIYKKRDCFYEILKNYHQFEFRKDIQQGQFQERQISVFDDYLEHVFNLGRNFYLCIEILERYIYSRI